MQGNLLTARNLRSWSVMACRIASLLRSAILADTEEAGGGAREPLVNTASTDLISQENLISFMSSVSIFALCAIIWSESQPPMQCYYTLKIQHK